MEKNRLNKLALQLNDVLGLDPPIDTKLKATELVTNIKDAVSLLEPGDVLDAANILTLSEIISDEDVFEDKVKSALQGIGIWLDSEEPEEEEPEEEEAQEFNLEQEVTQASTIADLKGIAKTYDEFKEIRGVLTKFKTADVLKEEMLKMLETPKETEPEEAPVKEKVKKTTEKKSSKNRKLQCSEIVNGLCVGDKVKFTTSKMCKEDGGKSLTGTVVWIKFDASANNEYVQIDTKSGKFHKVTSSVTKV